MTPEGEVADAAAHAAPFFLSNERARMSLFSRVCALGLALLFSAGLGTAQTGSIDPTLEELSSLPRLGGDEITLIEEPVVDLRRWLPRVGEQRMNDCTAWAVGYAAKSYLEARDQGWRPDHPSRIFSPLFLYNQLNGGKDEGTNFYKMVKFMEEHGCATLATSPYVGGNFTLQPSARARSEAAAYPVIDLVLLTHRNAIRRSLQRRQVVVFGAHVNPMFLSGRFKIYTPAKFVEDAKMRQLGQPHGKHAMVIAGYDDARQAFLIQNSWGERWNEHGYAWVAYELFDRIEISSDDSVFCNWACTIEDLEQKVEVSNDGSVRAPAQSAEDLRAHGYSDISRYDRVREKYVYVFSAELRGPRAVLDEVKQVHWTWIGDDGKEASATSSFAITRFSVIGSTIRNPLSLRGAVQLNDGTTRVVKADIVGPNPKADFRDAKIRFKDDYYGPRADGVPLFWWEAHLDFPLEQRDDIVKVVWTLGEMNRRDPVQTNTGFNGKPGEEKAIGMCAKATPISAEIHYIDGGIKSVSLSPEIRDQVREEFAIDIETTRIGPGEDGRSLYSWALMVDRPRRKQFEIDHVTWTLDPLFSTPVLSAWDSFESFPIFGTADRDFRAIATLHMADGSERTLERWIELAADTKYPDADRLAIDSWNRYLGGEWGGPSFSGHARLVGDRRVLEQVECVFFQEETGTDQREYQVYGGGTHPTWPWSIDGGAQAVLHARILFKDGREKKIRHEHHLRAVPDDNVGFHVVMQEKPETYLDFHHQDTHQYTVTPIGPDQDIARIVGIEWLHRTVGPRERSLQLTQRAGFMHGLAFTSVLTKPFELEARVHYHTGFDETMRFKLSRLTAGEVVPDLGLRVREKFWGYEDGKPYWQIELSVARDHAQWASKIKHVSYVLHSIDRDVAYKPFESTSADGFCRLRADRPSTVHAQIEFEDGRQAELDGFLEAKAKRSVSPIFLQHYHNNYAISRPNRWLLVVDAWESVRSELQSVTWDAQEEIFDLKVEFSDGIPGVIVYERSSLDPDEKMRVVVHKKDGSVHEFEEHVGGPLKPTNWTFTRRYYGDGAWEVDACLIGDWWNLKSMGKSFRIDPVPGLSFDDVGAWPMGRKRARAQAGTYSIPGAHCAPEQRLAGVELVLGTNGNTPTESLSLSVTASPFVCALATVPEWILAVSGPEKWMRQIEQVVYTYEDSMPRVARVKQRWGEFYECFEHRAHAATAPAVRATVHFADGTTADLEYAP